VLLAAGLQGIEEGLEAPEPVEENVFHMSEEERKRRGIGTLPANLGEAIAVTENSKLVKKALGDMVFEAFIKNKKIEWDKYRVQVSDYEKKTYLPLL
jgi:glutamine synthetase